MEFNTKGINPEIRKQIAKEERVKINKENKLKNSLDKHSEIYKVLLGIFEEEMAVAHDIFDYYKDYEETEDIKLIKRKMLIRSLKYLKMMKIELNEIHDYFERMSHHNIKKNNWEEYLEELNKMHREVDSCFDEIKDSATEEVKEQMIQGVEKKKELTLEEREKYNFKLENKVM